MAIESACLGLEILGSCAYDPADPPRTYFTIGSLISVIALVLAFSQLARPVTRFRIQASKMINLKLLFALFLFGILCVFVASTLPFTPGHALPLLGYPVFWELLAGVVFVAPALVLIVVVSIRPAFSQRNALAYMRACIGLIARGKDEDLGELADEIAVSVKPIFEECKTFDSYAAQQARESGKSYEVKDSTKIAFTILDLWSDKKFCRSIVTRAPATAIEIFTHLVATHPSSGGGYSLSQQLMHEAFENRESILMREEDYSGLGFFKQFRNTAFGSWKFIDSQYRPLQGWRSYEGKVGVWQVQKYSECLKVSFQAYLKARNYWQPPDALIVGVGNIVHVAHYQAGNIRHFDEHDLYRSDEFKILDAVGDGLEKLVDAVEQAQNDLPEYEFLDNDYHSLRDKSIYGVVAKGINDYFEALAWPKKHDWALRSCAVGVWLKVFSVHPSEPSKAQREIGRRLLNLLKQKVDENLDPAKRWYPAITRVLITLDGLHEPESPHDQRMYEGFHKEFLQRLKIAYPRLVRADREFAEDLLPENVIYDRDTNELRENRLRDNVYVLKLLDPNEAE